MPHPLPGPKSRFRAPGEAASECPASASGPATLEDEVVRPGEARRRAKERQCAATQSSSAAGAAQSSAVEVAGGRSSSRQQTQLPLGTKARTGVAAAADDSALTK